VNEFMQGKIAEDMDKDVPAYYDADPFNMLKSLPTAMSLQPLMNEKSAEALHWIGYLYRYWALLGTPSKDIIQIVPVDVDLSKK